MFRFLPKGVELYHFTFVFLDPGFFQSQTEFFFNDRKRFSQWVTMSEKLGK